jgi:hypothetical protein
MYVVMKKHDNNVEQRWKGMMMMMMMMMMMTELRDVYIYSVEAQCALLLHLTQNFKISVKLNATVLVLLVALR